jgi:hypothetical protein
MLSMIPSSAIPGGFNYQHPMRLIALTYMPGKTAYTTADEQLLEKYYYCTMLNTIC